jgi:hypothetical protein
MDGLLTAVLEPHGGLQNWARRQSQTNADQVFYFDRIFMQRRMDYSPDLTGKPPIAHYTYDPKTFDGFVFPTRRSCTSTTQTASQTTDYINLVGITVGVIGWMCRVALDEIEYADGRRFRRGLSKRRVYAALARLRLNHWALSGDWTMNREAAVLNNASGQIAYRFHARDLHLVMGPAAHGTSVRFRVLIDGKPPGAAHGIDVDEQGNGTVTEQRMHQLIRQPKPIADRQFEIEFLDPGVEAFAFTFG